MRSFCTGAITLRDLLQGEGCAGETYTSKIAGVSQLVNMDSVDRDDHRRVLKRPVRHQMVTEFKNITIKGSLG